MRIHEGETTNYSESLGRTELVIVDASHPDFDEVVSIPDRMLARNKVIQHPRLPFRVNVLNFFPNSTLARRKEESAASLATQGFGKNIIVTETPRATKVNEADAPSAIVEIVSVEGSIGTWLCSTELSGQQNFQYQDKI